VDTELNPTAVEKTLGSRELVIEPQPSTDTFADLPRCEFTATSLRRARIALGEYARTTGIYDPVDVMTFTRLCIEQATARVNVTSFDASDALLKEVLRIASTSCGVSNLPRRGAMKPQVSNSVGGVDEIRSPASAAESFVATIADQAPVVAVPPSHERAMPPQPLGELPDVRPARVWSSLLQVTKRAMWSLVSSMFVRSE